MLNEENNNQQEILPKNNGEMFEKYEKIDSKDGFTTNKAEIPKLRASRRYKIVTEKLLGSYDDNGKYVISPHIMAELLALPKMLDKEDNGKLFLTAEYKDGTFFKFIANEPRKKQNESGEIISSTLEFCEEISFAGGYEIETIHHVIGSYKNSNLLKFEQGRKTAFNIYDRDDPGLKARTPTDAIDGKLEYLSKIEQEKHKKFEKIEKKFYKQTIRALKKLPNGKLILEKLKDKQTIVDNFVNKKDKSKFRAYNDMLSLLLQENDAEKLIKTVDYQKTIGKINKQYLDDMKKVDAEVKEDKKIQEINQARNQIKQIPVDEYFKAITSGSAENFSVDTSNANNKNTNVTMQNQNTEGNDEIDLNELSNQIQKGVGREWRDPNDKPEIGEDKSDNKGEEFDYEKEVTQQKEAAKNAKNEELSKQSRPIPTIVSMAAAPSNVDQSKKDSFEGYSREHHSYNNNEKESVSQEEEQKDFPTPPQQDSTEDNVENLEKTQVADTASDEQKDHKVDEQAKSNSLNNDSTDVPKSDEQEIKEETTGQDLQPANDTPYTVVDNDKVEDVEGKLPQIENNVPEDIADASSITNTPIIEEHKESTPPEEKLRIIGKHSESSRQNNQPIKEGRILLP